MRRLLRKLLRAAAPFLPLALARKLLPEVHPFDLRHRTDTSGLLYAPDLPTGHDHDASNEGYYATAPSVFHALLARWQATLAGCALNDYAFVDLGCGKGRVLLMASGFPFRSITGIEMHAGLADIARRNTARWLRRSRARNRIEIVTGDVLSFPLPPGPVVLFLFNAFDAEIARRLRDMLVEAARTRTAPIDLLYVHPDQAAIFERSPYFELLAAEEIPFSREDAAADLFHVAGDVCHLYRIQGQAAP